MDVLDRFLAALLQSLAQSAPWLVLGYAIAAVVREWVPNSLLARWFAGPGMAPVARAGLVGAMLPMCSCTVVPLGASLAKSGAAPGSILAFLMTGPALSPVAVLLFISLLGPTMAALLVGGCLLGALGTGLLANYLLPRNAEAAPVAARDERPWRVRVSSAGRWAWRDLAPEVSVDLVIGLTIAAAVLALLPMDLIGTWLGTQSFLTLLYIVLIGIPVYTCTVPSIPVVQSLLLAGMSPGAGIAFLLTGPATNLGEILVLRRALGGRTTALFVGGLIVGGLGTALVADHLVFANYSYHPSPLAGTVAPGCCLPSYLPINARPVGVAEAAATIPWWHWPFVAVMLATLVVGLARRIARRGQRDCPVPGAQPAVEAH